MTSALMLPEEGAFSAFAYFQQSSWACVPAWMQGKAARRPSGLCCVFCLLSPSR
jgi:hypothetical protein